MERVERNGHEFVVRNLDVEPLTEKEASMQKKAASREFSGRGAGKVEREITSDAMLAIIQAKNNDIISFGERNRRRVAAMIAMGYSIPERAITEEDEIDFTKVMAGRVIRY